VKYCRLFGTRFHARRGYQKIRLSVNANIAAQPLRPNAAAGIPQYSGRDLHFASRERAMQSASRIEFAERRLSRRSCRKGGNLKLMRINLPAATEEEVR